MQQTQADLLLPSYRRAILARLLLHPDEALHGREIARQVDLPSGTVVRELNRLAETGFLIRQRLGLRKQRNVTEYSGDLVSDLHTTACNGKLCQTYNA
jgi:predicted transcriptional regulator